MQPSNFEGSNGIADTPPGVDPILVQPLYVYRGPTFLLSCWKPTAAELKEINRTGRVWLFVHAARMPPVSLQGNDPFAQTGGQDG